MFSPTHEIAEKNINIIIVDDEREACSNLSHLLLTYVDTRICIKGTACNTTEAEAMIRAYQPDAVFLDIEMPGEDAFHFLDRLKPLHFEIIFVSAYDEYAVKAFRLNAIDYILKPIDIHELCNAVKKLEEKRHFRRIASEWPPQAPNKVKPNQITLRNHMQIEIVDFKDLLYIEANGNYSRVFFQSGNTARSIMMSHSIAEYEELLPDTLFYRIHKSYLVNCRYIRKILKEENPVILLDNKYRLPVGRRRYKDLLFYLKNNNFPDV
ncbi:MAG TPA: LytTR family DNA-binding domain-containing protein [Chitinophaga sp.]|uniref:LytR/AlgR family response regulator transcription factor n=1 Tax=Chitinophaga sp. TaxID=1869181 RepID=UPI002BA698CF|nr:LytTR family DNA-binding domain-containing protein [Chitinophaga sp.]HVI43531.1 LytTR family DNA-binding domain-containing protein [Chitinophaga sp.]